MKKLIKAKHLDLVPDNHKCSICGKGKGEVNFGCSKNRGSYYVRKVCGKCVQAQKYDTRTRVERLAEIRARIDEYFKNL